MMMRRAVIIVVTLAAGCTSAEERLDARLVQLETRLTAVERRADGLTDLPARVTGLEAALAVPAGPPPAQVDLEARVVALEAIVERLERSRAPAPTTTERAPVTIPSGAAPPAAGSEVQVLSAGAGDLLLARTPSGLVRVALLGVEAPQRGETYAERLDLRERHVRLLGNGVLVGDEAFDASRAHLEGLVLGGTVTLSYGPDGARGSIVRAYVSVTKDGQTVDVNASMIADGFAFAAPERHERAAAYDALAAEAQAQARGLFAPR
jgi:endonuclease YncB( thermonuclease family)